MKTLPVKGCVDYLPSEMELRQQVLERILRTYKKNGFLQVKTPILENLENLTSGDSGDNTKMMFKTVKRGVKLDLSKPNLTESDIVEEGLRYDLTVPLARLFTKNRNDLTFPFKSIQADDSFRAEKPQEGRNRQFTQCDVDIWGEPSILGEIEIITTTMEAYESVGLPEVVCKLSNRKILTAIIEKCGFSENNFNDVCIIIDKLEKIGIEGCKSELSKNGYPQKSIDKLATALADIQEGGLEKTKIYGANTEDVETVETILSTIKPFLPKGYSIKFDISIVRGQGYYTGCVFEMYCYKSGYRGAIGGGGRYDKMYAKFAGENLPAVGYGLGLDSVLLVLKKLGVTSLSKTKKLALIYRQGDDVKQIMEAKNRLKKNYDVAVFPQPKNFKELIRKLKLNGFQLLTKLDKTEIEEL